MLFFKTLFGPKKTSSNPPRRDRSVWLSVESLEERNTPSHGGGIAAAARDFSNFFAASQFGPAVSAWSDPSSSQTSSTLTATLTGATGTSGSAAFTTNTSAGTNRLNVQVAGLGANTTYTVLAGTTTLGTITTNASGAGTLSASNVSATLSSGAAISVTDPTGTSVLSGTLATSTTNQGSGDCGQAAGGQTLAATLTGASGASGTATFNVNTDTGTNQLAVQVSGLTASTNYTVQSGTTTLGSLTTNTSGSGSLALNNISASLGTGSTITVADPTSTTVLSGTLAAQTSALTRLTSTLAGASGTSGTVSYAANSGTGTNSLLVNVSGLTANATYTVLSGTNSLGTLSTDANGNGSLLVSNVSPALASGGTITVADSNSATVLSGTLAAAPATTLGHHHGHWHWD